MCVFSKMAHLNSKPLPIPLPKRGQNIDEQAINSASIIKSPTPTVVVTYAPVYMI